MAAKPKAGVVVELETKVEFPVYRVYSGLN